MHVSEITRRPLEDRYVGKVPREEWPAEWTASIVGMLKLALDPASSFIFQDVVDYLDYGPDKLSPRQVERLQEGSKELEGILEEHRLRGCCEPGEISR